MSRIKYQTIPMRQERLSIIDQINTIIETYLAQGFDLTLRQIFYQMIARDLFPESWADKLGTKNTESSYKKLGEIINDGRLAGLIDWDAVVDRTRNLKSLPHWNSPSEILESCASQFRRDKWREQSSYVEVWVEKDALIGVLDAVCPELDVPYFSCRGYVSQSEMWSAAMRFVEKGKGGRKDSIHVIHLGDHDPSGIDMTRDIEARIQMFVSRHSNLTFQIERIALNIDQVREFNPPPNPAKITDSRAVGYIDQFGEESWELDALEPAALIALIRDTVTNHIDMERWGFEVAREELDKETLQKCADRWDDVEDFLKDDTEEE